MAKADNDTPTLACACGCGFGTIRADATFNAGHDQRLMGTLQFAWRNGLELFVNTDGLQVGMSVQAYGAEVLTETGQAKLAAYLVEPKPKAPRARKPKAPKRVKIGRWEYELVRIEEDGSATYLDKSGQELTSSKYTIVE